MKIFHSLFKKNSGIICILIYLISWFVFGCIYCYIANLSHGQSFVFQEDILLQTKNNEFQKELKINIDTNITKDLFLNYNNGFILTKMSNDTPFITYNLTGSGIKPIGEDWANYYIAKWKSLGYNFCTAEFISKHQKIIGSMKYCKFKFSIYRIPEDSYRILSDKELIYLPDVYRILIQKKEDFYLWINEKDVDLTEDWTFTGNNYRFAELDIGRYFISNSVNYFDDAIDIIYNYEKKNEFKYPLVDFLYFSAVTITTLGYGDILPNSSIVRSLVMTESILGAIILAIFISFLYDRIKNH